MIILPYSSRKHKEILKIASEALKQGKIVAFPTDTLYGLAADASNAKAIDQLYRVKGRQFAQATHVVVPSIAYAKTIVQWNSLARKVCKAFWPGALSVVLPLIASGAGYKKLSAGTGTMGLRMPDNRISLDLAKFLGAAITATGANVAKQPNCYDVKEIIKQYARRTYKPDIIIDAGQLKKQEPSTMIKITGQDIELLRPGPVSMRRIQKVIGNNG